MSETLCPYCHSPIKAHYTFCAVCGKDLKEISQKDKELFEITAEMTGGDMSRFTRFFELTKDDVYGCLASFKLPDEDREDLSQEVYLKVFQAIGSLREVKGVRGWLKKLTVNCAINQLKKQNKEIFVDLPTDENFDGDPMENLAADTVNIPEDLWMNQEKLRLIGRAVDALPQNQKIAITAMYLGEMTIAEISLQTGMNQNTIKTNLSRGRNSLRIEIERIERKEGVRLHSVAFTPFLYMLFKSYLTQVVMPEAVSAAVLSGLQDSAAQQSTTAEATKATTAETAEATTVEAAVEATAEMTEAASAGAETAASSGAKGAALVGKTKLLAAVLAVAVAAGAIFAGTQILGSRSSVSGSETDLTEETAGNEGDESETDTGSADAGTETGADTEGAAASEIVYETRYFIETYRETWDFGDGFVSETLETYTYDELGNIIKKVSTESYDGEATGEETVTEYTYDEAGNLLSSTSRSTFEEEEYSVTETTYDANGNVLTRVTYTEGVFSSKTEYTYDADGNMLSKTSYEESEDEPSSGYEYAYDAAGNQTQVSTLSCNSDQYTSYTTYDDYGNILTYEINYITRGYSNAYDHTYTYDENGNILTDVEDAEAYKSTTTMTYDNAGRLLTKVMVMAYKWEGSDTYSYSAWDTQTISWEYTYDEDGNQILYVYTNTYADNPGETVTETETDETVYENGLKTFSRYTNELGEVTEYTFEYTYDENGNLLSEVCESSDGDRYEYTYDENGNLLYEAYESTYYKYEYAYTYIALDVPVTEE